MNNLAVSVLQDGIRKQMNASKDILDVARSLQKLLDQETDQTKQQQLQEDIEKLVGAGKLILGSARETGNGVRSLLGI
jgi:flagellar biosynthesis/type III secretory pathway chaperone